MNLRMDCAAVQQCGSAAVRAAVCGSAHGSVRAVRAAVCGSVLGSVWRGTWQCAAFRQYSSVRQCARQCAAVLQCVVKCGSKHGSVRAMCAVRAAVWGSAHGSVRQCGSACVTVR
jgi:hypothetical protein